MRALLAIVVSASMLIVAPVDARTAKAKGCDRPVELDKYRLLRRLSVDLRGQVPSYEEHLALEKQKT
jgi:hypothetical protein